MTPRTWRNRPPWSKTGSSTNEWSSLKPVAQTTASAVASLPSANVTVLPAAEVARARIRMPCLRAARGLEPMSVSRSFMRAPTREVTVVRIRPVASR